MLRSDFHCQASKCWGLYVQSDLRRAVANTKRGKRADGQQQRDILRKVEALEALDPTSNPVQSELLSGRWSLLYTGAVGAIPGGLKYAQVSYIVV